MRNPNVSFWLKICSCDILLNKLTYKLYLINDRYLLKNYFNKPLL